jgi:triacylglycerol lipase
MNSGSIVPVDTVDFPKGQEVYDTVVKNAGCASASDTLECLWGVDYTTYLNAANSVPEILGYNSAALSYLPRPDETALTDSPEVLVEQGKYAKVPFIVVWSRLRNTVDAITWAKRAQEIHQIPPI